MPDHIATPDDTVSSRSCCQRLPNLPIETLTSDDVTPPDLKLLTMISLKDDLQELEDRLINCFRSNLYDS